MSTGAACFIASCTQVEKAYETVKTAALSGFEWISERTKDLGDMVMGRVEPPEDDGSACHAPERLSFYESVSQIRAAQRAQYGAAAALVGATLGAIYFKSTLAKLAVAGFGVAMAKILHDIAEDRKLTVDLTGGFETLVDCRRTAARKVNAGVVTGKLTRAEAQSEMEAIRTSLQEDIEVAEGANHILSVRTESFSVNAERLNKEAEPPANEQEAAERVEEDKKVQAALQTNQNVLNQQVTTIAEAKDFEQSIGGFDTV